MRFELDGAWTTFFKCLLFYFFFAQVDKFWPIVYRLIGLIICRLMSKIVFVLYVLRGIADKMFPFVLIYFFFCLRKGFLSGMFGFLQLANFSSYSIFTFYCNGVTYWYFFIHFDRFRLFCFFFELVAVLYCIESGAKLGFASVPRIVLLRSRSCNQVAKTGEGRPPTQRYYPSLIFTKRFFLPRDWESLLLPVYGPQPDLEQLSS